MPDIISFSSLKYQDILENSFQSFDQNGNNILEFKMRREGGMVVIYGPNGTGKTTLANLLGTTSASSQVNFSGKYNEVEFSPADQKFHVISDQSSRNIIRGNTSDYLVGDDIRREYELNFKIEEIFNNSFSLLAKTLKNQYNITKKDDYYLSRMQDQNIAQYIRDIIPSRNKRSEIDRIQFSYFLHGKNILEIPENSDERKENFIINNLQFIQSVLTITQDIGRNEEIQEIEQSDDAVKILKKYRRHSNCIVCDAIDIDVELLIGRKNNRREYIYNGLSDEIKSILDGIVNNAILETGDPFSIRSRVLNFICTGNYEELRFLKEELEEYIDIIIKRINNLFLQMFSGTDLDDLIEEYTELLERQPELDSEEIMLINEVVNENIGPQLTITRDPERGRCLRLALDGEAFLSEDVGEKNAKPLELSTGERNFISLAFELLLARHSQKDFIVLDDPISSFDSVYKNKIAFCIMKFLEKKKTIVLTHNLDLVKLLEFQNSESFNLYIFNNVKNELNGFIRVKELEKKILTNLHDLIKLLRNDENNARISDIVVNKRVFLMAMIPFLRGYAHIICTEDNIYASLSSIMHGYENGSVNITEVYKKLFGFDFEEECIVSVQDIIQLDCTNIQTVDENVLPLFAKTLKQTLIYYHLRMAVESVLVTLFPNSRRDGEHTKLGTIIMRAFRYNEEDLDAGWKKNFRVFFTSRKTLLNEFNHFEGNMNIFQPAIDIEDSALRNEVDAIHTRIEELQSQYS